MKEKEKVLTPDAEIEELEQSDEIQINQAEEKINPRKVRRQKRNRFFFITWNLLAAIFYSLTTFLAISKKWSNSILAYIILGGTIVYIIVFLVLIICSSKNKKVMKTEIASYKTQMALWRTILNFLNIAMAVMVIVDVLQIEDKNFFMRFSIVCAIILVVVRILMGIRKIIKLIKKQKKLNEKKNKIKAKEIK